MNFAAIALIVTVTFAILKLSAMIAITWFQVFLPMIVVATAVGVVFILSLVALFIGYMLKL